MADMAVCTSSNCSVYFNPLEGLAEVVSTGF